MFSGSRELDNVRIKQRNSPDTRLLQVHHLSSSPTKQKQNKRRPSRTRQGSYLGALQHDEVLGQRRVRADEVLQPPLHLVPA